VRAARALAGHVGLVRLVRLAEHEALHIAFISITTAS
jgi:hypothetical protein